ncbi:MAG: hypothetical protein ABW121_21935, partial [Candidatus Thiodiazotropha sp. 6PLUC7]
LVSHDREFLDNAVTSCLVFEGEGKVAEYVGGYSDWEAHLQESQSSAPKPKERALIKSAPERPKKRGEKIEQIGENTETVSLLRLIWITISGCLQRMPELSHTTYRRY